MQSHASHRVSFRASLIGFAALMLIGCSAQDAQQLQQTQTQATALLSQAQAAQAQIQQQLTTRPASDPSTAPLEAQLQKLDTVITQIQSYITTLNSAIGSLTNTGTIDPAVQQTLNAVPYGSIILAGLAVVFGVIKHVQAGNLTAQQTQLQKALTQVVAAMDAAIPSPTPQQQATVAGVLDNDVKTKVAEIRGKSA